MLARMNNGFINKIKRKNDCFQKDLARVLKDTCSFAFTVPKSMGNLMMSG